MSVTGPSTTVTVLLVSKKICIVSGSDGIRPLFYQVSVTSIIIMVQVQLAYDGQFE